MIENTGYSGAFLSIGSINMCMRSCCHINIFP